jgi:hypothetical protein
MVKDADGTIRYESAERASFSDGSMEQDLPMQQLSEMFNVNHFIISQANPHAVMFASYNHLRSVWSNPISGFINAVLAFLKDRCRTWLAHVVELVGSRRIAPSQATSRAGMTQFFVQEYQGRDCDISLIPWINHRGLVSAFMHCLYNPCEEEFREWVQAAERETWKYIPAIKSHIAEEITLDRCVQRLRKRLVVESWEKRRADSTNNKMGERVPSFFTSPSLVNLGGMNVADQTTIESLEPYRHTSDGRHEIPSVSIQPGWSGLGLSGNKSFSNLERSTSNASGLFIEGDESQTIEQPAGEQSVPGIMHRPISTTSLEGNDSKGYIKTSSMAHFYYRNTSSQDNLKKSCSGHDDLDETVKRHNRRKSQSTSDITSVAYQKKGTDT